MESYKDRQVFHKNNVNTLSGCSPEGWMVSLKESWSDGLCLYQRGFGEEMGLKHEKKANESSCTSCNCLLSPERTGEMGFLALTCLLIAVAVSALSAGSKPNRGLLNIHSSLDQMEVGFSCLNEDQGEMELTALQDGWTDE